MTSARDRAHIVLSDRGWIQERQAREIEQRLTYVTIGDRPDPDCQLNYYMTYSSWNGRVSEIEVALFTHVEEDEPARERFFSTALQVDHCISLAEMYADQLRAAGVSAIRLIRPGVDPASFQPRLRIGVVGRTYHTGRKGEQLLREVLDAPGIEWAFVGTGWPGPCVKLSDEDMPDFYRSLDYLLVPARIEGGPMPALEALACGTPVISGPVGFISRFPHLEFRTGDAEDLRRVLAEALEKKMCLHRSVQRYSWDRWAEEHDQLFRELFGATRASDTSRHLPPRKLRVLFSLNRVEAEHRGGPSVRARRAAEALRELGQDVVISTGEEMTSAGFDLAHVFNAWPVDPSLSRLRQLSDRKIPVVFSPIFMDYREMEWARPLVEKAFESRRFAHHAFARLLSPWTKVRMLRALRRTRPDRREVVPASIEEYHGKVRKMIGMAHHVVLLSCCELQSLRRIDAEPESWSIVRNSTVPSMFEDADPTLFRKTYDLEDYVLCVGRIEHRKNQVMLLEALRRTGSGLVLVGNALDGKYDEMARTAAWSGVRRVEFLENGSSLLASAYAGASAFVLPSWVEGAPVSALEAAACGCPLVLSNRSGEREYFGALAEYCEPSNPASIRDALYRAFANDSKEVRMRRRALVAGKLGFGVTAKELLSSYHNTLERLAK